MGLLEGSMMVLLAVQNHIISCSLDSTIKVWNAVEPASPGAVLDINAAYIFPPEEPGKPVSCCCLLSRPSMHGELAITCCYHDCRPHPCSRALSQHLLHAHVIYPCWQISSKY